MTAQQLAALTRVWDAIDDLVRLVDDPAARTMLLDAQMATLNAMRTDTRAALAAS